MSETGTVGTFGGIKLPTVAVFMDGFSDGVDKYNEDNGADVKLLGWDKEKQDGLFAGKFDSPTDGKNLANNLIQQGADIIMPVAGGTGLGRCRRRPRSPVARSPSSGSTRMATSPPRSTRTSS